MRDHQPAAGDQQPARLDGRPGPVEPVPALAGADDIVARRRLAGVLGTADDITRLDTGRGIELLGFLDQRCRGVEPGDRAATQGEAASERASAGAEVEHALAHPADAEGREPVVECVGKARAIGAEVGGRLAEVDVHLQSLVSTIASAP